MDEHLSLPPEIYALSLRIVTWASHVGAATRELCEAMLRGLAARAPPSHLLGARRFHCFCHRKQNNGQAEREIPAPTAIAPRNDALSSHEMERNLGSVWGGTIDLTDETQERATKRQGRVDRLCKAIMEAVPVVGD
jgi:hypothetical protein